MVLRCAVRTCTSSRNNDRNRRFYQFPSNTETCTQWIEAIGRPELFERSLNRLVKSVICDLHFDLDALEKLNKKMKNYVVPTLNLPSSAHENPSKETQVDFLQLTPESKREHKKRERESINLTIQDENVALQKHLKERNVSMQLKKVITMKMNLNSLFASQDEEKVRFFAINVFLSSPQIYGILYELLSLPSEKILRKTSIGTKLSGNTLQFLTTKVKNLKVLEKYCILCVSEITLKSSLYYQIDKDKIIGFQEIDGNQTKVLATHALVITVRGLFSDWQQPIGYCLLGKVKDHEEINKWFGNTISKLLNIGLKIVAFVPAKGSFFYDRAQERLAINRFRETYFTVNENKVYYIFDIHDLIKSLINNFMKYDLVFYNEDKTKLTASWKDIERLHTLDINRSYRLAPDLTKCHIDPNEAKNLKTEQYFEIFNKRVAAAISSYRDLGEIGDDCIGTIKFIELVSKTFNVLNASLIPFAAKSNEVEILIQFLDFTSVFNIIERNTGEDVTKQINCLSDLRTTLKSILLLLRTRHLVRFHTLPTHRLNQNILQKFLNGLGEKNKRPTPAKFSKAFQKLFMMNLFKYCQYPSHFNNLPYEQDAIHQLLNRYQAPEVAEVLKVGTVDYRFDLPAYDAVVYLTEYLLKKCFEIHKCDAFRKYLLAAGNTEEEGVENKNTSLATISPRDLFIDLIKKMDEMFVNLLQNYDDFDKIGSKVLKELSWMNFYFSCSCFPNIYLKRLFIRYRIFNIIQFNNKNFKQKDDNLKCFKIVSL